MTTHPFTAKHWHWKMEWRHATRELRTNYFLVPTVRINNWMPHWNFYHVSFLWWSWAFDIWRMKQ